METKTITIEIAKVQPSDLSPAEQTLLTEAKAATFRSYSPYSHFSVGAAVMLADGTVVTGNNQENCAYPSGLCAERTALFYAHSRYPDLAVTTLCVAARGTDGEFTPQPITPCGSCRQVLAESESRGNTPIRIILYGTDGCYIVDSASSLLPLTFDSNFL